MATRQLRGVPPKAVEKRLKALFYGPPSGGKTMAAIQFPRPYLIDAERGAENPQYEAAITKAGGAVFASIDFADVFDEVTALHTTRHEYRTLIIDPITTIYDDLLDRCEKKVGEAHGRHYGEARKQWKRLGNLLLRLDMNVIITSHQKAFYNKDHELLGNTFDGPKGLDYLFDLVFEVSRANGERTGRVVKTRIDGFPDGTLIPFSYPEIAARYGRKVLERDAVPVNPIADADLRKIMALLASRTDGDDLESKMLARMAISSLSEMTADQAKTWLDWFTKPRDPNGSGAKVSSEAKKGGSGHTVSPSAVNGDAGPSNASPAPEPPTTTSENDEGTAVPAAFVESSIAAGVHRALKEAPKTKAPRARKATVEEMAAVQDAAHTESLRALWAVAGELGIKKQGVKEHGIPSKVLIPSERLAAAARLAGLTPDKSLVSKDAPPFIAPRYLTTQQIQYLTHHLRDVLAERKASEAVSDVAGFTSEIEEG